MSKEYFAKDHELIDQLDQLDQIICAECQVFTNPEHGKECPYSEDFYCNNNCFNAHMKKNHYFYNQKVLLRYTQHRLTSVNHAIAITKQFIRQGNIIDNSRTFEIGDKQPYYRKHGVYMVREGPYGRVRKFDYYVMSHDEFVEHFVPQFIVMKGRDESQAGREAIC
jgi:hypothetical protein